MIQASDSGLTYNGQTYKGATEKSGKAESAAGTAASPDPLAKKEVFLSLLVAQIKNQDPLNPTDSVQFLTQLSQFTQTEQTLGIRDDLKQIKDAINQLGVTKAGTGQTGKPA